MVQSLNKVCSWIVSQVQAGISWVVDNWPMIKAKAGEMGRRACKVAIGHLRKAVVACERGMVIGIETVEKRQSMPFKKALAEAKAVVKAMTDEQVCAYAAHWFNQDAAQAVTV